MREHSAKLQFIAEMANPFDYPAFATFCEVSGLEKLPFAVFAQNVDLVQRAKAEYPEVSLTEAVDTIIAAQGNMTIKLPVIANNSDPATPCGSCGGGKVL